MHTIPINRIQLSNFQNAIHGQPDCASHNDHIPYLNAPEVRKILKIPDYVQKYEICRYRLNYSQKLKKT